MEKIRDHAEFFRYDPIACLGMFPIKGANSTPATTIMSFSVSQKAPFGFYLVRWEHFTPK
jgi:hypothetical protein